MNIYAYFKDLKRCPQSSVFKNVYFYPPSNKCRSNRWK
jgi:hypothetical protein